MMKMRSIVLSTFFISAVSAASQDLCFGKTEVATKLNFFNSKVTENKLHDGGDLRYTGVGKVRGKDVDLVVSVAKGTQYSTTKPTNNGKSGYFGNINMMTLENSDKYDGEGTFDFCFRDSTTNDLTTVDSFRWSFFDVDERGGTANGIKEMIVMDTEQVEDFILYPNTKNSEIQLVCEDSGKTPTASNPCRKGERTQFKSSTGGKGSDNPRNPNKLTEQQKKRSILYTFKNKSCFTVQFRHYCPVKKCRWYGGGNFQFAGEADELIEEGECITKAPKPTQQPTRLPTLAPTKRPTNPPTNPPTKRPTNPPTNPPTKRPTNPPTNPPTKEPTNPPTNPPTKRPTNPPTNPPTKEPSNPPTNPPTGDPTNPPTNPPTTEPTNPPTKEPTSPPTDSPTFVEDTVGEPELCLGKTRVATNLDFFNSVVTENDLQNGGVLKYEGIGKVRDRNVDLIVSVMPGTTYTTPRNSNGKGESNLFGNISLFTVKGDLKSGQGNFKFCFHDSQTGDLTKVDSFRWSVYDVDDRNAAANGIKEKMSMDVSQASDFILYPNQEESEIQLVCEDSGLPAPCAPGERTVFHASTKGVGGDNPTDPNNLTEQQKKRSVVFTFHDTDCWEFTYDHYCRIEAEEGKECRWYGGGNFLFAGDANEIIEEGECLTSPPTVSPSTGAPTQVPTEDIEQINPPSPTMCPEDVKVSRIDGVTPFESSAVEIVSQDTETVTVKLTNAWESGAADAVDAVYYNYRENLFNWKCYEETDVFTGQTIDTITIRCNVMYPEAFLEICIADSISNEFLAAEDDATIPKCCHADTPPQSATVCYTVELSCKSTCTNGIEEGVLQAQNTNRSLRGGI